MFKIAAKRTLTWPVTVSIPQDGGKTTKATFKADFEVLGQDELLDITNEGKDVLERVLTGWEGVADENGAEIPFNAEAKAQLLQIQYVRQALYAAYGELQNGRAAARKN